MLFSLWELKSPTGLCLHLFTLTPNVINAADTNVGVIIADLKLTRHLFFECAMTVGSYCPNVTQRPTGSRETLQWQRRDDGLGMRRINVEIYVSSAREVKLNEYYPSQSSTNGDICAK